LPRPHDENIFWGTTSRLAGYAAQFIATSSSDFPVPAAGRIRAAFFNDKGCPDGSQTEGSGEIWEITYYPFKMADDKSLSTFQKLRERQEIKPASLRQKNQFTRHTTGHPVRKRPAFVVNFR
jgi:hypothetical protein